MSTASKAPTNYATVFTNAKAGMAGVNTEHVKQVVYEMSKVCSSLGKAASSSSNPD